ncbi:2-C-methyl-D-erythritol 4-phosphate cytidylyltransferase [bacterium]|nr:2-C-methyl-D-erythritol 4-phosphate cytidylyltransferase [bacterium]
MFKQKHITVIIPAAGVGQRMKSSSEGKSKQFLTLQDRPLIYYTLKKFEDSEYVDDIIIVCEEQWIPYVATDIVDTFEFTKVRKIVTGGAQRQDSVFNGLQAVERTDIVLVHDAVRPFISTEKINALIEECLTYEAVILAVQPKDTIKSQDHHQFVDKTLDRTELWNVQTPQAFHYGLLIEAFDEAKRKKFYGTDESTLVEAIGVKVKLLEGEYQNIKITTPEDLVIAEAILAQTK